MRPTPIAHIGVLVSDVESAREHWTAALGQEFSPIVRYRTQEWSDLGTPLPHAHDLRQTISFAVEPSIEIQEFVNSTTHGAARGEGGHHLGFPPESDNNARRGELADVGLGTDGEIIHDGRCIMQFTDPRDLNNVATEWVEASPAHLDLKDDGSPVDRLPDGSSTVFDAVTVQDRRRPPSGIVEIGVVVSDLDAASVKWAAVTGYQFARSGGEALSLDVIPAVRLVQPDGGSGREGLVYAVVSTDDIDATLVRLTGGGVPLSDSTPTELRVDSSYLNGFSLRFRVAARAQ